MLDDSITTVSILLGCCVTGCTAFRDAIVVSSSTIKMHMSVDSELSNCVLCELLGFCICTGAAEVFIPLECGSESLGDLYPVF